MKGIDTSGDRLAGRKVEAKSEKHVWLKTTRGVYCLAFSHSRLAWIAEEDKKFMSWHPSGGITVCGMILCRDVSGRVRKALRREPKYQFEEARGVALCSVEDIFDREKGECLSLGRALKKLWPGPGPQDREERKTVFALWRGAEGGECSK